MTSLIGGFATSHATALLDPQRWDGFRELVREAYRRRFGTVPPEPAEVAAESKEHNERRYAKMRALHDRIAAEIKAASPDAVILLGNDQDENFCDTGIPQFAIYTGATAQVHDFLNNNEKTYCCAPGIAEALLTGCVRRGFDVMRANSFNGGKLKAHAHAQVFARLIPDADIPVIPIFINAITPPLPTVKRCFDFGRALGDVMATELSGKRVMIGASGGLSHFTSGYPYELLTEDRALGSICADYDRTVLEWIKAGELQRVTELSDQGIIDNGDVEFRQGIAFLGALTEGTRPTDLLYEPFYRGLMGFWVGYWDLRP